MSDNQKMRTTLESLRLGKPVYTLETSVLTHVSVSPAGELVVDFVVGVTSQGEEAVMRLSMAPEAAKILKAALGATGNIRDAPIAERDPQSMN